MESFWEFAKIALIFGAVLTAVVLILHAPERAAKWYNLGFHL